MPTGGSLHSFLTSKIPMIHRHLCFLTALLALSFSGACAADVGFDAASLSVTKNAFSPNGRAVLDALAASHPDQEGVTWRFSGDATLEPGWLVQTATASHWGRRAADLPQADTCDAGSAGCDADFGLRRCVSDADCTTGVCAPLAATVTSPGQAPSSLCVGHSEDFVDAIYDVIVSAESYVDLASLSPPDGRFEAAIRNGITYLANAGRTIEVRALFGNIIFYDVDTDAILESFVRDLPRWHGVTVSVGAYRYGFDSWNHAKIVAADGEVALVGGHNLWTDHYLSTAPVHDISMRLRGSAAGDAHRFADELWDFTCNSWSWAGNNDVSVHPWWAASCPSFFGEPAPRAGSGGARVITVGRLGRVGADPADVALSALLDSADDTIRLSIQDLGPVSVSGVTIGDWPEHTLGSLARAALRGVDVYVALSTPGSKPGGLSGASANYGNGWTAEDVAQQIAAWVDAHPAAVPAGVDPMAVLCERLHVSLLRFGPDDTWEDGAGIGNHSKMVFVDDRTFYIGSQNLYDANLAELGYIVDDATAAATLRAELWDGLWEATRRVAVTGTDAASCIL